MVCVCIAVGASTATSHCVQTCMVPFFAPMKMVLGNPDLPRVQTDSTPVLMT